MDYALKTWTILLNLIILAQEDVIAAVVYKISQCLSKLLFHSTAESIMYIKANIGKIITIEELAGHLKYSNSHYSALFRNKIGISPIEYFIKLKIQYACQLLSQSNLRISDIADKIGYEDTFYFSRLFKKVTGKSPRDYKNSISMNKNYKSS
ncbi:MAG: AraC family transcriptional regulator [Ginsengibacter sp.]